MMDLDPTLFQVPPEQYGDKYREHLFQQYTLYVASAHLVSERRQTAHSFFLSINTLLIAFLGLVPDQISAGDRQPVVAVAITGVVLCYTWYRLIRSYRGLNRAKFKAIQSIEQHLPLAPYYAEWEVLERGKNPERHLPFTRIETRIPWVFAALYVGLGFWWIAGT
jgi:hypothetical protein